MGRNQALDILKLIFVICIFINHLNHLALPGEQIKPFMSLGFLGVEFFFMVGGYFMASKAIEKKTNKCGASND